MDILLGRWTLDTSPFYLAFDLASRVFSPYDFGQQGANPLRDILAECVDFAQVARAPIRLFVTATNVRTGRGRVFRNAEITPEVLLASACLPTVFQAIEIEGEPYWDGGYTGNPPIFPLIYNCSSGDVLIVQLSPSRGEELPRSSLEILNRVNEISFNSSLIREMRAIRFVTQLIDDGYVANGSLRRMRIHAVAADDVVTKLGVASKLDANWDFLTRLRDIGRDRAGQWLDAHFDRLGIESTVDLQAVYM